MGRMTAQGLAEFGSMGVLAHLQSNMFPPQPRLLPVALRALTVAREAQPCDDGFLFEDIVDESFPLPEGVLFQGRGTITAREAIESLHLEEFVLAMLAEEDSDG